MAKNFTLFKELILCKIMHIPPTVGHYSHLMKGSNSRIKVEFFYLFLMHTIITEDRSKIVINNMTLVSLPQPLEYVFQYAEPQPDKENPLSFQKQDCIGRGDSRRKKHEKACNNYCWTEETKLVKCSIC